jgi:peptide/nickel transport system permease protein
LVFVLLLVSVLVFIVMRLIPGDPANIMLGTEATPEMIAEARESMGLNRPLAVQYLLWLRGLVGGDLGRSWVTEASVVSLIERRFPASLQLALFSAAIGVIVGIPTGVLAALRPRGVLSGIGNLAALVGICVPNFWIGQLLILLFAVNLRWLPSSGYVPLLEDPVAAFRVSVLPAVAIGIGLAGPLMRYTRSGMLEVLRSDYVRTARAKGVSEVNVTVRHALRNALLSVVTVLGLQFGALFGNQIIVEQVFVWPGLGTLVLSAIGQRDYAVMQGVVLLSATIYVLLNLLTDITYGLLDPRIRYD